MFFGTFIHAIDAKGRTSLPAKFREALASAGEPKIVLTQYPHWKAVQALPLSEWKRLEEKLLHLYGIIESADDAPTRQAVAAVEELAGR